MRRGIGHRETEKNTYIAAMIKNIIAKLNIMTVFN